MLPKKFPLAVERYIPVALQQLLGKDQLAVAGTGLLVCAVRHSVLYAIFQPPMYLPVRGEESDGFDKDQLTLAMMMR